MGSVLSQKVDLGCSAKCTSDNVEISDSVVPRTEQTPTVAVAAPLPSVSQPAAIPSSIREVWKAISSQKADLYVEVCVRLAIDDRAVAELMGCEK